MEHLPGPGFEGIAVFRLKSRHSLLIGFQQSLMLRVVGRAQRNPLFAGFHGVFQLCQSAAFFEKIQDIEGFQLNEILGKIPQGRIFPVDDVDTAAVQLQAARDGPQQGRLARAVVSHQTDPAPRGNHPAYVVKDHPVAEGKADIVEINQNSGPLFFMPLSGSKVFEQSPLIRNKEKIQLLKSMIRGIYH